MTKSKLKAEKEMEEMWESLSPKQQKEVLYLVEQQAKMIIAFDNCVSKVTGFLMYTPKKFRKDRVKLFLDGLEKTTLRVESACRRDLEKAVLQIES